METLSSELLFQLIENMPTMAYYCDVIGDCKFVNKAYTNFTGYKAGDVGNFRWIGLKLVHPDDVLTIVEAWKNSIGAMEPYSTEYRLMHVSGEYRWVRSRAFYVKDNEGQAYAWFGTIEDIHDYKIRINDIVVTLEVNLSDLTDLKHRMRNHLQDKIDSQNQIQTPEVTDGKAPRTPSNKL